MRVGVTGARGFIGSHLMRALQSRPGCDVHAFTRTDPTRPPQPAELKEFVRHKDLIYHLGGVNRGSDEAILHGNVLGTLHLLIALKSFGNAATRIVFASSTQVYSLQHRREGISETQPAEPDTVYGISKKTAEDLIRISGFEHAILRLANVYGPRCRPDYNSVIATFCDRAAGERELSIDGDGRQGRDFIYIDDVIRALLRARTRPQPDEDGQNVYNVGSGKLTTLREVVESIQRAGAPVQPAYRPQENGGVSYWCDSSRFQERYRWAPETSLASGILSTYRWFKEGHGS